MTDTPSPRTLSVLVDNEAGVLSQVSRLFSRKGFNIESLAVGPTDDPALSRITIEVLTGIVALERGQHTIRDERKETTEFNLGKSLL